MSVLLCLIRVCRSIEIQGQPGRARLMMHLAGNVPEEESQLGSDARMKHEAGPKREGSEPCIGYA